MSDDSPIPFFRKGLFNFGFHCLTARNARNKKWRSRTDTFTLAAIPAATIEAKAQSEPEQYRAWECAVNTEFGKAGYTIACAIADAIGCGKFSRQTRIRLYHVGRTLHVAECPLCKTTGVRVTLTDPQSFKRSLRRVHIISGPLVLPEKCDHVLPASAELQRIIANKAELL